VSHLDDDHVHGVVCVDALFFAANNLAEDTALDRDALVLARVASNGKGVFVKTERDGYARLLKNGCDFVAHDESLN
jgi:hypothetical protein